MSSFVYRLVSSTFSISCRLTVTRRVFLVVQDMFTLPKPLNVPPIFYGVRVAQSVVFSIVFCKSLYDLISLFFQPLHCLSFDLRVLISSEIVWIVDIIVWVRGAHMSKLCSLLCLCALFVLWPMSPGSLYCPFWIAPWRFIQFNFVSHE